MIFSTIKKKRQYATTVLGITIIFAVLAFGFVAMQQNQSFADAASIKITDWYIAKNQDGSRYLHFHYNIVTTSSSQEPLFSVSYSTNPLPSTYSTIPVNSTRHHAIRLVSSDSTTSTVGVQLNVQIRERSAITGRYTTLSQDRKDSKISLLEQRGNTIVEQAAKKQSQTATPSKATTSSASAKPQSQKDTEAPPAPAGTEEERVVTYVTAPTEFGPLTSLGQYMEKIMKYALPLGIALATLSAIYGGIMFMLSQGQPDKIKDGQEIIQGAIVGLIVLILARLLATYLYIPSTFEPTNDEPANPLFGLASKDIS